jgi:glycosyltransferase involved in cell wall biosynthesis
VPTQLKPFLLRIERIVVNGAHEVILPSITRLQQLRDANVIPRQFTVIENANKLKPNPAGISTNLNPNSEKINLGYVGILTCDRSIERLVDVVAKDLRYNLKVIGFGPLADSLSKQKFSNISFLGKKTHDDAMTEMLNCDIYVALYDQTNSNHKYVAPNKLYEGLQLGKPLLIYEGTSEMLMIKELKNAVVINEPLTELDFNFLYDGIQNFDRQKGLEFYEENFSEDLQFKKYISLLKEARK